MFLFMTVVRTELSLNLNILTGVILRHIQKSLRNHDRNPVLGITQSAHKDFHCIKALAKDLMTECKACINFPHD